MDPAEPISLNTPARSNALYKRNLTGITYVLYQIHPPFAGTVIDKVINIQLMISPCLVIFGQCRWLCRDPLIKPHPCVVT